MLESNSPRDNRCDSSRTMGKGVAVWSRPLFRIIEADQREAALSPQPVMFSAPIGPIDRPCLGKLNRLRRRIVLPTLSRPAQTASNVLPMSQEAIDH
jgi:hypothetical protein